MNGSNNLKLHLGCGDKHIDGMINCDCRKTKATDIVRDCISLDEFDENSANLIFSNAFFEHIYRSKHIFHLANCYRVLRNNSPIIYLGIPDFEIVAKAYINKENGILSDTFDLYHVYRFTHGDPESTTFWLEQLHKSIFDKDYIYKILVEAGFSKFSIFNYCFPGEKIPLNTGFVAWKSKKVGNFKKQLNLFKEYIDNIDDLRNIITKE